MTAITPDEVDTIITHGGCKDGFLCYVILRKFQEENGIDRDLTCIKAYPGYNPPKLFGRNILITDVSYSYEDTLKLMNNNNVLVLDHHITAEKELEKLDDDSKVFDMNECGASLTWNFCYPDVEYPLFVKYIRDNDLWKNEMTYHMEFGSWIGTVEHEYETYLQLLNYEDVLLENIMTKGPIMYESDLSYVMNVIPKADIVFQSVGDKFLFIAYINPTHLISLLGDQLIINYPYIDFSAPFIVVGTGDRTATKFCMRSTDYNYPCSDVATYLGGGGHRNASSVTVNSSRLTGSIYDSKRLYKTLENIQWINLQIGESTYQIALLEAPYRKYELSKYLLQTKYECPMYNTKIQSACDIIRKRDNTTDVFDFGASIVYSFNYRTNTTSASISFDKSLTNDDIKLIKQHLGITGNKNTFDQKGILTLS